MQDNDRINDTKYLPNELPHKINRKMYVTYSVAGWLQGEIKVWDIDVSDSEKCLITTFDIDIDLPITVDLKDRVISGLEKEKSKVLADAHMKAKELQEKIDNLKQLEYHHG